MKIARGNTNISMSTVQISMKALQKTKLCHLTTTVSSQSIQILMRDGAIPSIQSQTRYLFSQIQQLPQLLLPRQSNR